MKFSFKKYFSTSEPTVIKTSFNNSFIHNFFKVNYEKIFFHNKTYKTLDTSLQYTKIRANLFYLNAWFVINQIRCHNNLKTLYKLYYIYQVKREVRQYNRKKIIFFFDDNYNKQVLDELNRSANAIFIGLDDYFKENIMKRELKEIIQEDILCEKNSEEESIIKYSNYILEKKIKINDFCYFLHNDFDLNKF